MVFYFLSFVDSLYGPILHIDAFYFRVVAVAQYIDFLVFPASVEKSKHKISFDQSIQAGRRKFIFIQGQGKKHHYHITLYALIAILTPVVCHIKIKIRP